MKECVQPDGSGSTHYLYIPEGFGIQSGSVLLCLRGGFFAGFFRGFHNQDRVPCHTAGITEPISTRYAEGEAYRVLFQFRYS